jgi:hypothetical protein
MFEWISICSVGARGGFFSPSLDYYKYGPTLKPLTAGGLLGDNLVAPKRSFLASSYALVSLT